MADYAGGWFVVSRRLFVDPDDFWVESGPWSKREAWLDLVQRAGYKPEKGRGLVSPAIHNCAIRWGWSRKKVRLFMDALVERKSLSIHTPPAGRNPPVYRVVNYESYQVRKSGKGATKSEAAQGIAPKEGPQTPAAEGERAKGATKGATTIQQTRGFPPQKGPLEGPQTEGENPTGPKITPIRPKGATKSVVGTGTPPDGGPQDVEVVGEGPQKSSGGAAFRELGAPSVKKTTYTGNSDILSRASSLRSESRKNGGGETEQMGMGFAGEPTGPTAGEFHRSGLQHWIGKQPYEPTKKEIGKQAGVLKKLISDHGGQSVLLAIMGVAFTFPHTKGEPWDFVTVRRRFSEFKANAAKFEEAMGVGDALEQFDSDWDSAREGLVL